MTHTFRPGDQKHMYGQCDGEGFYRSKGCEKSVNGHRPGDIINGRMVDTAMETIYNCGCKVVIFLC